MTNADPDHQKLTHLRKLLIDSFDLEELRLLCFDLGLDYEELAGKTKSTKMQDLVTYLQRRGELQRLLDAVKSQRPNVDWPDFAPTVEDTAAEEKREHGAMPGDQVSGDEDTTTYNYIDEKTGLEMIYIPAGEFIFGGKESVDDRGNVLTVRPETKYLPDFWISKTPVTVSHFHRFAPEATHWRHAFDERYGKWRSMVIRPPAKKLDHPIVEVSWRVAKFYADWANMALPSAEQWEKAARGTDGRIYPWGNKWRDGYCNTKEEGIATTTPVGQYSPQGDSPYGCVDMAGNVREWTTSSRRILFILDKLPYARGGSYDSYQDNVRVTDLFLGNHNDRQEYSDVGFRLVRYHRV